MKQYLDILYNVLNHGKLKKNRTGIDTISVTGAMFEHDLKNGFPLVTTKFVSLKNIAVELEFFIKGLSDKKWLQDRGCNIWNEWGNPEKVNSKIDEYNRRTRYYHDNMLRIMCTLPEYLEMNDYEFELYTTDLDKFKKYLQKNEQDLGGIYGVNWRNWSIYKSIGNIELNNNDSRELFIKSKSIHQLDSVINMLKTNPFDRRMIVSSWNYENFDTMALPPCHYSFQLLSDGKTVDLLFNMRSVDLPIGFPYNVASYALLLMLISKEVNLVPGKIVGFLADAHIYVNQIEQVKDQITRQPYNLPTVIIPDQSWNGIYNWEYKDFILNDYKHHKKINMPVSI